MLAEIGLDNLFREAQECYSVGYGPECENPYWDDVSGYYRSSNLILDKAVANPVVADWLLKEVRVDRTNPANWDPIWIGTLANDPTIFQNAKNKAFQFYEDEGYGSAWDNELFLQLFDAGVGGH